MIFSIQTVEHHTFIISVTDSFDSKVLSPAYNEQMAQNNGFIVGSLITNSASDTRLLPNIVEQLKQTDVLKEDTILIADAGYGSLENYEILKSAKIKYIIPYMMQRFEGKRKYINNPCTMDKFKIKDKEYAVCPEGEKLLYQKTVVNKSRSGFETYKDIYSTSKCSGCPLQEECAKGKISRNIYYDQKWMKIKREVREE